MKTAVFSMDKKESACIEHADFYGVLKEIRTPDPQLRRLVLYPAEL